MIKKLRLMSSTLDIKNGNNRIYERKLIIAMQVLHEMSVEFPDTKNFIEELLEQKYLKENISVEEVIYFSLTN